VGDIQQQTWDGSRNDSCACRTSSTQPDTTRLMGCKCAEFDYERTSISETRASGESGLFLGAAPVIADQ